MMVDENGSAAPSFQHFSRVRLRGGGTVVRAVSCLLSDRWSIVGRLVRMVLYSGPGRRKSLVTSVTGSAAVSRSARSRGVCDA